MLLQNWNVWLRSQISYEDKIRLRHILDAGLEIRQYIRSVKRED